MESCNHSSILITLLHPTQVILNGRTSDSTKTFDPQDGQFTFGAFEVPEPPRVLGDSNDIGKTSRMLLDTTPSTICIGKPRKYMEKESIPRVATVIMVGNLDRLRVINIPVPIERLKIKTIIPEPSNTLNSPLPEGVNSTLKDSSGSKLDSSTVKVSEIIHLL